jgi:PmbA protein
MMDTNEKYKLANMVIDHAVKNGANQVSVVLSENRSTNIEVRDLKIDTLKESNQSSLSINLYVDNKYSSHSTNRLKKEELLKFVEEAIIATRYLAEDEFRTLPEPELYFKGEGQDLQVFDPELDKIDAKAKIELATNVLNEAYQKDERIISVSSYYSDSIRNRLMVNSNGFKGESSGTSASVYVSVSVKTDTGRPSDGWYESALFYNKLNTEGVGKKALDRTLQKIDPKKIASGKYSVIIENVAASNIFYPLVQAMQARSIYQKQSFLIGKENKAIASPLLSIVDDPFLVSSPGSRHFDGEGLALSKRPVIEKGVLKTYYIDTYYGKKLGMKPTSGGFSNLVFSTGNKNLDQMILSMKKGVLITGFNGGNCNGTTGDFSYGLEGYFIENGKIVHPVSEMNISGNMNQFWLNLAEVGNDPREDQSLKIPALRFDNVDLSGV